MSAWLPTYEYSNGQVSAVFEGKVIAEGGDFSKVASSAEEYLTSLRQERKARRREAARKEATHITTPNGLTGEILSRVAGIWCDEVTVRFENGNIQRMEIAAGDQSVEYVRQAAVKSDNAVEAFEQRLAAQYDPNREGLAARLAELDDVRLEASHMVASASLSEQKQLHGIALAAEAETAEIKEALAHLDAVDSENAAPAAPVYAAVEQVELGCRDNWLEVTAQEMIADSEAQDFDKILAEGPTFLVSSLDDGAIAHAGTVHEIASSDILAKTAGFQGEAVEAYREQYIAAAETARRQELRARTQTAQKTAKAEAEVVEGVSDEALFLS